MSNEINLLITLVDMRGIQLLRAAIKLKGDALTSDEQTYFLEPENKAKIMNLLPLHCQDLTIVEIQNIFEIIDLTL